MDGHSNDLKAWREQIRAIAAGTQTRTCLGEVRNMRLDRGLLRHLWKEEE